MSRAWIAAIILVVVPASHCADGIRIAEIGLKGYYYPEYPAPVRVMVIHSDPRPATVAIRVRVHSFAAPHIDRVSTFEKGVVLAPNEQRVVQIPVLLQFSKDAAVQVQEVDEHGAVLSEDTQPLEPPLADQFLIGILCVRPDVCQQAQSQISFSGNTTQQTYKGKSLRFVTLEGPYDQFWAYLPAQTLILARPIAGMTASQTKALEDFARQGGALIVLEDQARGANFLSQYRRTPSAMTVSTLGRGRVLWVPSLAGNSLGDAYAGPDLERAVRGWHGDMSGSDDLSWARSRLAIQFRFPTLLWLLLWLAAYVLLAGVGNFILLRKLDRREWGWVTLPCISLVFACAMYLSGAAKRPRELHADDVALYWMDENTPAAFVERGERISSNRRQTLQFKMDRDVILAGDRNRTGDSLSFDVFGNPQDDGSLSHWNVQTGASPKVELRMLQWSFRDLEFVGVETRPGTVRRLDEIHLRNETGKTFRQAMYVDKSDVYFLDSVPGSSEIDLTTARKVPLERVAGPGLFPSLRYPTEIADVSTMEYYTARSSLRSSSSVNEQDPLPATGLAGRPFDLAELIRGWPANGGHSFDARSGLFFGLADEAEPANAFPGQRFTAKGYSITIVSYERKP